MRAAERALLAVLDICAVVSPIDENDPVGSLYEHGLNDIRGDIRAAIASAMEEETVRVQDMCACAAAPVNYWRRGGRWTEHDLPPMTEAGIAGAGAAAETDGEDFNTGGYDCWVIACPSCGKVYAAGGLGVRGSAN